MPNLLEQLKNLIDEQDPEQLEAFISNNQDINYDCICPNGASALWWALMPPVGKGISLKVITCLLNYRKNDGNVLVSPVQGLAGLTPRQYLTLCNHKRSFRAAIRAIYAAENEYVAPEPNAQDLAAIAADDQSAHDSHVSTLCRSNIIRLYQYCRQEKANALDEECLKVVSQELQAQIELLRKTDQQRAQQMQYALEFCYSNPSTFKFTPPDNNPSFHLTLAQLVALNWMAANEQDPGCLPNGATDLQAQESRKNAVLNTLYDIATAYGHKKASCAGGACNRLGIALASQHNLVKAFPEGEKIKGDMARLIVLRILGSTLEQLAIDAPDSYWAVIRYSAVLDASFEDEQRYANFIAANKDRLNARLVEENIEEGFIKGALAALDDDYNCSRHPTSYQLIELMRLFSVYQHDLTLFDGNTASDEVIARATAVLARDNLQDSESFLTLKEIYGVKGNAGDLTLEAHFIYHWLEQTRLRDEVSDLKIFMTDAAPCEFSKICFLLSLFTINKEALKQSHPAQAKWLEHLTNQQVIDILSAVYEDLSEGKVFAPEQTDLLTRLALKAIQLGLTTHMSLEGIQFKGKDLRAFDFSNANLTNARFEDCLLPIAGENIQATGVQIINCQLPYPSEHPSDDDFDWLFLNICSELNYKPSPLLLELVRTQLSESLLQKVNGTGDNFLMVAAQRGYTEIAQTIVESDYCSLEVFARNNRDQETALLIAAREGYVDILRAMLASQHCLSELKEETCNYDALIIAAIHNRSSAALEVILESEHCSKEWLEYIDDYGNTVLTAAAWKGLLDNVKAILRSPHYTKDLLNIVGDDGYTALILATFEKHADIIKVLLRDKYCTKEYLTMVDKHGDTVLTSAVSHRDIDAIEALLASEHCTIELLEISNNDGYTALMLANAREYTEIAEALKTKYHNLKQQHKTTHAANARAWCWASLWEQKLNDNPSETINHCSTVLPATAQKHGYTPLSWAVRNGQIEVVKAILKNDSNSERYMYKKNVYGNNPLIIAAREGQTEMVVAMLKSNYCSQDVLAETDSDGYTALMWAAANGHTGVVEAILASEECTGWMIEKVNVFGETAIEEAENAGHTAIARIIQERYEALNEDWTDWPESESSF